MCRKERLMTSLGHLSLGYGCGSNSNNKKITLIIPEPPVRKSESH